MKKSPKPTFLEEKNLWRKGYKYVIGIDEVGRGAFAGPVVTAAVIFKKVSKEGKVSNVPKGEIRDIKKLGINDSKLLTPQKREELDKEIKKYASHYSISEVGVSVINKVGIGKATSIAFRRAIATIVQQIIKENDSLKSCLAELVSASPEILKQVQDDSKRKFFVLADGFHIKYIYGIGLKHQKAIIKGDQKSNSIAAASIIAKVHRDRIMTNLSKKYPQYHFEVNKGYGTKEHQQAIKKHGLSKVHRSSFNLSKFISCR